LYTNAQSVLGKVSELECVAADKKPDIILVCESWCNDTINNALLTLAGYELQPELRVDRHDTVGGIGGGLLVYVRNCLSILYVDKINDFNQYCNFTLTTKMTTYSIYLIYRPPAHSQPNKDLLLQVFDNAKKNSIFIGDFNLPRIDWQEGVASGSDYEILKMLTEKGFEQLVTTETHVKGNILDLVITNCPEEVMEVRTEGRLGRSDHEMLWVEIEGVTEKLTQHALPDWRGADWEAIRKGVSDVKWEAELESKNAEESWILLREKLQSLQKAHIPERKARSERPPWMTTEILRAIRKKRRLWKKARTQADRDEYEKEEKRVKNVIRAAKRKFEKNIAFEDAKNKKPFFNYVRKKTKARSGIGPLKEGGRVVSDDTEMADVLNEFFSSVFTREDTSQVPEPEPMQTHSKMSNIWITTQDVKKRIEKLKNQSSPGLDGITPRLLKETKTEISPILARIFRKSMDTGIVPAEWKQAKVVPIFKKGTKTSPGNYRPVSLTSICCKLMEGVIRDQLVAHLQRNRLINPSQHGFMKSKSCTTNLLEFLETVTEAADRGEPLDIVYLDFAKAFDKVPKERLIKKLAAHGVTGQVRDWIRTWLSGRTQRVSVNGKVSRWKEVLSGVPQGSVLGPVLFTIFINDLDRAADSIKILTKFADDTKAGHTVNSQADAATQQECLNKLMDWATNWGMQFNADKCKVMHVGKGNLNHQYNMGGVTLGTTEEEKDVGVMVHQSLKPARQCARAAQTARGVLGQISRAFHYRDRHVFVQLYKQYVRPHLEFASPVWSPWLVGDIKTLEEVQIAAVRMVSGLKSKDYHGRLAELGLTALEERRREMDLVQTFKIVNGIDHVNSQIWFEKAVNTGTRGSSGVDNMAKLRAGHDFRRNFFSQRVVDAWNSLPDNVKMARNVACFKRLYRRQRGTAGPA